MQPGGARGGMQPGGAPGGVGAPDGDALGPGERARNGPPARLCGPTCC